MNNAKVLTQLSKTVFNNNEYANVSERSREIENDLKAYYDELLLDGEIYNSSTGTSDSIEFHSSPDMCVKMALPVLRFASEILTPLPKENTNQGILFDSIKHSVHTTPRIDPLFNKIIGTIDFGNNDNFLINVNSDINIGGNVE